jgi:hypothetical protein
MRVIVLTSVDWPACRVLPVTGPAGVVGARVAPTAAATAGKVGSAPNGDAAPPAGVLAAGVERVLRERPTAARDGRAVRAGALTAATGAAAEGAAPEGADAAAGVTDAAAGVAGAAAA